jgi:predicted aminopeptidase
MTTEPAADDRTGPEVRPRDPAEDERVASLRALVAELRAKGDAMYAERIRHGESMDRI